MSNTPTAPQEEELEAIRLILKIENDIGPKDYDKVIAHVEAYAQAVQGTKLKVEKFNGKLRNRDYRQYVSWQVVHLLRSLKVMESLTPIQQKLVEAKSDTMSATINEDIEKLIRSEVTSVLDRIMDAGQITALDGHDHAIVVSVDKAVQAERSKYAD